MTIRIDGTNTAANPGITGTDTDTGLQFGTDEVNIVTGGSTRATVDSSGRVGIGETNMDGLLVIKGNSNAASNPSIRLKDGTDTREAWISNASGDLVLVNGGDDNVPHCKITLFDGNILSFETANTERMRIDSSGRVGIGASNPEEILHLSSGAPRLKITNTTTGADHFLAGDSGVGTLWVKVDDNAEGSNPAFIVDVGGTERVRVTSTGALMFNSGYGSVATAYGVRVWACINQQSTQTIRASGNISSITDTGTGRTQFNFSNAMPDNNYAVVATGQEDNGSGTGANNNMITSGEFNKTTGRCEVFGFDDGNQTFRDYDTVSMAVIR